MNKKKCKNGLKFFNKTLLVLLLLFSGLNVFAVERNRPGSDAAAADAAQLYNDTCATDYSNQEDIEKCKKTAEACYNLIPTAFDFKLITTGTKEFKLELTNKTNNKLKFKIVYTIEKTINGQQATNSPQPKEIEVGGGKVYSESFATGWDENTNIIIKAHAQLISDYSAQVTAEGLPGSINCNGKYFGVASAEIPEAHIESFDNPDYYTKSNGLCYKYMNNGLTANDVKSYGKLLNDYSYTNLLNAYTQKYGENFAKQKLDEDFRKLYPYCYNATITKKDINVIKGIYNAVKTMYESSKIISSENVMDPLDPSSVEIKDLSKPLNLTCDAFGRFDETVGKYISENNTRKFHHYFVPENSPVEVEYKYNYNHPEKVTVCSFNCREDLTITYGPPVSVQAGSCFEYEVKVESKVTCDSVINESGAPNYQKYQVCEPIPICENAYWQSRHQAGPTEEFDECIQQTDGGKYTQKAINKCYKKVYGKTNKKTSKKVNLALKYTNIQKMANTRAECNTANINGNNYQNVYNIYNIDGYYGGYYKKDSNGFRWEKYQEGIKYYLDKEQNEEIPVMDGCYWNAYARFYFNSRSISNRTVLNDKNINGAYRYDSWDNLGYWYYFPSSGENGVPKGIKHAKDRSRGYAWCHDTCYYVYADQCDGKYYNQVAPVSNSTCSKNNNESCNEVNSTRMSAYQQYLNDYNDYLTKLDTCKAMAKCSTETSTYKMVVDKLSDESFICETGDEDSESCTSWTDTNKSKKQCEYNSKNTTNNGVTTQLTGDPNRTFGVPKEAVKHCKANENGDSVVREISGVCTEIPGDSQDYRTIIGFPGTWIKSKSLTYRHKKPENTNGYVFRPNEYCVGTTIDTVNKDWYKWDEFDKRSSDTSSIQTTTVLDPAGEKVTKVNGKYNIRAFIETFGDQNWKFDIECFYAACKDKDCGECTPGDKNCPNPKEYDTKIITLDELFPSTENTSGVKNDNLKEIKPSKLNNSKTKENNVLKVENSQTAGRIPGFNWSCDATSLLIPDYPITPTALIAKIQTKYDKASDVYKDNSEVDFKLTLTPENIKNIRENNKAREKAGEDPYITDVNSEEFYQNDKNNINFYESKLLQNKDANYVTSFEGPQEHTCNNMLNGKCDNYTDYYNISTCSKLNGGE